MKYLLGIDFGGGSSKATLLSSDGKIVAESSLEYLKIPIRLKHLYLTIQKA